jgi:hypothetical protein
VELAERGDWIVGTGGANEKKSAGHHKIVFAMKGEEKITRGEYFRNAAFARKKPTGNETDLRFCGDNISPKNQFQRNGQYVLISRNHFYYFGRNAISIPRDKLPRLEKRGPGFRRDFDANYIRRFERWITARKPGRHGDPCKRRASQERQARICKPSC